MTKTVFGSSVSIPIMAASVAFIALLISFDTLIDIPLIINNNKHTFHFVQEKSDMILISRHG
jgi:hypothetical protein